MKVGEYVRTNYGIAKITKIDLNVNACEIDKQLNDFYFVLNENIIKSSPNIIDLIEVGDVITTNNLCGEITKIDGDKIYTTCYDGEYCSASDIKSIVTKEQFESMKYKIGE